MIGTVISHYKIIEKLGEGGMGVVYKAQDLKLDRLVALKFLPQQFLASSDEVARFQQEAKAISALNHPNIATIYDVDQANGQRFLVLEFLSAGTLKSQIKNLQSSGRELSIAQVLDYGIQIADGLAHAHKHGIVHRDVKTDNAMLTEEGRVKITDFGLAKLRGGAQVTKTGTTVGTAAYMSPEQVVGESLDHRSDLFSFGIVLYELLTNQLPFRGEHEAALSYSIVNEQPTPIKTLRGKVPDGLERVVQRCLEKEKEKRYQSAEGIVEDLRKVSQTISGYGVAPSKRSKLPWTAAAVVVLLAAVALFLFLPKKTTPVDRKSIAVLPFKNLSEDKENEFFSDGITEDIITQISKISELKVISRTSVMQYKGVSRRLRDIGQELGVATVLEGSVRRAGNQVRIVAQLIEANTDEHLWAETYDRELTGIFAIQSDIARQIAAALKAKLTVAEKERIEKQPTENLDAYTYYLKGREYYYRYRKDENEKAIELFKKALELDPKYALAYAGLGDCYGQRTNKYGFPDAWKDSAIEISNKAISIDPHLAEGYKALALGYQEKGWYRKALEANKKAVEFNPNYHPAVGNIGWVNWFLGNLDEALPWMRKSVALNPSVAFSYFGLGITYLKLGDDVRAEESFNKALELQPDLTYAHVGLILMDLSQGNFQQARERSAQLLAISPGEFGALAIAGDAHLFSGAYRQARDVYEKAYSVTPNGRVVITGRFLSTPMGCAYLKIGNANRAKELLDESFNRNLNELQQGSESPGVPYDLAAINAVRGNKAEAYKWLQRAIDGGWIDYRIGLIDPMLENLRSDDQFKQLMDQVKAKVEGIRKRVEQMEKESQ